MKKFETASVYLLSLRFLTNYIHSKYKENLFSHCLKIFANLLFRRGRLVFTRPQRGEQRGWERLDTWHFPDLDNRVNAVLVKVCTLFPDCTPAPSGTAGSLNASQLPPLLSKARQILSLSNLCPFYFSVERKKYRAIYGHVRRPKAMFTLCCTHPGTCVPPHSWMLYMYVSVSIVETLPDCCLPLQEPNRKEDHTFLWVSPPPHPIPPTLFPRQLTHR